MRKPRVKKKVKPDPDPLNTITRLLDIFWRERDILEHKLRLAELDIVRKHLKHTGHTTGT